jgi:Superinfection immunity protein
MSTGVILVLVWYFTPWLVALYRGHRNKYAILALDLFAAWTLAGWVAALIWSLTDNIESRRHA